MTPPDVDSWNRYQKLVLSQLSNNTVCTEKLGTAVERLSNGLNEVKIELVKMSASVKSVENLKDSIKRLEDFSNNVNREVGELKVKSGLWGSLSGAVTSAVILLGYIFKRG